ncbi:MAG: sensor domain-containing diguanylate cyclase [Candidatus Dormibacteria bacterium]
MNGANRVITEFRNIRDWRLSTKIMIGFLFLSMAAIFALARLTQQRSTEALTATQSKLLTSLASSAAIQVDSQVLQYRRDATQVATDPETITFMAGSPTDQQALGGPLLKRLTPALAADPDYRLLLLLDPAGHVVLSNGAGEQGQDFGQKEFFVKGAVAPSDQPYVSDISLAEDHRTKIMYISMPVRDAVGKVLGVAAIRLSPDHVASPLFGKDLASQHQFGFLVNRQGVILANSAGPSYDYRVLGSLDAVQSDSVKRQFSLDKVESLHLDDLADKVSGANDAGFATTHLLASTENDVIGYSPIQRQRWTVLVVEDQAVFTAAVNDLTRNQFFNTLILALIIGSLVILAGRMFENTERESLSDPLTGLANRRFFQEILLRELRRAQRGNQPLSLIIADIDHFKGVNDTYGHNIGDEVLEQVGSIMLASVRATDFVIRYGGEEFVVLMPETRSADAVQVANKLRKTIGDTILESTSRPGMTLKVTISGGVSSFPGDGQTGEQLILRADRALYWAKEHGRNRIATMADIEAGDGSAKGGDGKVKPMASVK